MLKKRVSTRRTLGKTLQHFIIKTMSGFFTNVCLLCMLYTLLVEGSYGAKGLGDSLIGAWSVVTAYRKGKKAISRQSQQRI